MESGSALVLVQPGDSVEAIALKARQTNAQSVELLVPADNIALQLRRNMAILRQILARDGIDLIVISSDDRVLSAARESGVESISVQGTSVAGPLLPSMPHTAARPTSAHPQVEPEDTDLLAMLDQVGGDGPGLRDVGQRASLDDLASPALPSRPQPPRTVPVESSAGKATLPIPIPERSAPPVRPRDEPRSGARRTTRRDEPPVASPPRRRALPASEELEDTNLPARPRIGPGVIVGLVLLVVALAAALWALNSRVTVVVHAPSAQVRQVPVSNEVIPIADTASDTPAVIAAPISTEAEFTVTGQVATQTTSPTSRAKGTVTIINTIEQALALPEGTEFIGKNAAGAEVRFAVDAPATVPAASTSASLTGRSTTYGQAQVAITARSPGAASNVPENTIKQILIPGQPLLDCGTSNFVCQSGPIAGGADEPQWVVTDADVQRVLGEALTGLYNTGIQQLRAQSVDGKSVVDETAITPDPQALGRPESYEPPLVTPPVGQVADPNTRSFTVLVRTRFTALAVPPDRLMKDQIAKVISAHFAQRSTPICSSAELMRPSIDRWIWDGASLKVNGLVTCEPTGALAPEVRLLVREALRGKTRAQAEAALQELRDRGLIGDVQIPDSVTTMPPFDVLLEVQFADAAKP